MVGHLGNIGRFSFNGNKIITTGGGEMIVTDNEAWARKAKYLTRQAKCVRNRLFSGRAIEPGSAQSTPFSRADTAPAAANH